MLFMVMYVPAEQCIKSYEYRTKASVNVHFKHEDQGKYDLSDFNHGT